jgi:uncharacterized repeat protein (TIGR01451 family)
MKRSVVFAFLAALVAVILAVSPVIASPKDSLGVGTVVVTNGIYTLSVQNLLNASGIGTYTVSTGASHPIPNQSVLYGGAAHSPGSTYLTVRVYDTQTDYVASNGQGGYVINPAPGYALVHLDTCFQTIQTIGNAVVTSWLTPEGLQIIQTTSIDGTTLVDSRVRVQTKVVNLSGPVDPHVFGVRYFWDLMIDGQDGSYLAARNPDGLWLGAETQWLPPSFEQFETTNDPLAPVLNVFGTVNGPASLAPTPPDLFQFDRWPSAFPQPFNYAPTAQPIAGPGTDSAVAYFWGDDRNNAKQLVPGESLELTQYLYVPPSDEADLSVAKTDSPDPVIAGQDLTYTITAANGGPDNATGIVVKDILPPGVTFKSATPGQGSYNSTTNEWTVGSLVANTSTTLTLVVTVNSSTLPGTITNTATVSGNVNDTVGENNIATAETGVITSADLIINKTGFPDPVIAGTDLSYTIAATNNGPSDASGVVVTDTLPAGVTYKSSDTHGKGTYVSSTGIWSGFNLVTGTSATLDLVVTVNSSTLAGTITNAAIISAQTNDPNTTNNSVQTSTVVTTRTDLAVAKTDSPDPVIVANDLTYVITATNHGPSDATGVVVTDTLPAGLTLKSATPTLGTYNSGTGVWTVGSLLNSGAATLTMVFNVNAPAVDLTVLTNKVEIKGNELDPDTTNNAATVNTTVYAPVVKVDKSDKLFKDVDSDGASPGDTLRYTAVINNSGNGPATGVVFTDTPDMNTTLVVGSVTTTPQGFVTKGNIAGNIVEVNVGTVAAHGTVTITFDVTINKPVWESRIANQAMVKGATIVTLMSNDPDTALSDDPTVTLVKVSPPVHGPSMSEWGIVALTALLGSAIFRVIRRKQYRS